MSVTPTQLRANLYKILDQVIATQQPIKIRCKGQLLRLVIDPQKSGGKLTHLKPHPGTIQVDPEYLVHVDWTTYWSGGKDL